MKKIIGVMGPGQKEATESDLQIAYEIGKLVAEKDAVLLTGGMSGVMEVSARGAQETGGITVGIGPTRDKSEMNPFMDIALLTGMGGGRNFMNVLSSDILIFVSVASPGTLSELAFAIQLEKPTLVIDASEALKKYISEFKDLTVVFVDTVDEVKGQLKDLLK